MSESSFASLRLVSTRYPFRRAAREVSTHLLALVGQRDAYPLQHWAKEVSTIGRKTLGGAEEGRDPLYK